MSTGADVGIFGTPGREQVERAEQALERIGIGHLADRMYTHISGGEQQLVLIARALAQNAKTIVMDEPTSALDYGNTVRVLSCVKQLAREGMTMVVVTHEMGFAKEVGSRVIFMDEGKIVEENNPVAIFDNPNSERLKSFLAKVL